ncbi:hypothetical protein AWC38_SpisGene24193 [Stylophora pistillata]|uniref:DNA-directed DNA polymerase n=1 Tax=Stylophora pistillata TaxID=50429 RepID=A0A2B4R446_STYPI|nr:hypothetical protein AWC38_SpisGene24193 [Stylophora pistillata]
MDMYQLDPAHYYISPGLAWDAASRYTQVELDTISDYDMYLFMEHGIRGGISMITHRNAQANNKYPPDYDASQPYSYIMYYDANNLYGWAMSQLLPVTDFKWVPQMEFPDVMQVADDASEGKFVEDEGETCFVAEELLKTVLKRIKPIHTGFSMLELSKLWMYQFHYDVILKQYGPEKDRLLFTDTDSMTYHIETEDVYHDMKENEDNYDTSDYLKDHPLYSTANRNVIGKFKDENAGEPVIEFVGLRPKMYAMTTGKGQEKKTAKGI